MRHQKLIIAYLLFLVIISFTGWAITFWALEKTMDLQKDWQLQAVNCLYDLEMQKK